MAVTIPTLNTEFCRFDKDSRTLLANVDKIDGNRGRFPSKILVVSKDTGREVTFVCLQENDPKFNSDQYDGEYQVYRPCVPLSKVDFLYVGQPYYFEERNK